VSFSGFQAADFDVFSIPEFAARMGELRARIRPKLVALGEDLAARIEERIGQPVFPHVAQHMRRRVHPPEETWVAFARDRKGYKRWTHYRIAISGAGVRVTVFVEDDADDKPGFGANLQARGPQILASLAGAPICWYTLDGGRPLPQNEVTADTLAEAGSALQRLKTLKFQAGIPLARKEAAAMAPEQFEEWALSQVQVLKPLYVAGAGEEMRK
jgi:uncharacterized protein YktB (UPF0637 family)